MTLKFLPELLLGKKSLPTKFIMFVAKELKKKFEQVCMHLKTHFKFLFNSSKTSTTSVHVILFLNTRLHHDPNKIGTTEFGSTKLEIQILQNNIQN